MRQPEFVCANQARQLFFDRFGVSFQKEVSSTPEIGTGPCVSCGAIITGPKTKAGIDCTVTDALSAKHSTMLAKPNTMVSAGEVVVKAAEGRSALFTEGALLLIEVSGKALYVGTAGPSRPLLEGSRYLFKGYSKHVGEDDPGTTLANARFYELLTRYTPKPPFLIVELGKKLEVPLVISQSPQRTVWCGSDIPEIVDLTRAPELAKLATTLGANTFVDLARLRAAYHRGPLTPDNAKRLEKLREKEEWVFRDGLINTIPKPGSALFRIALARQNKGVLGRELLQWT